MSPPCQAQEYNAGLCTKIRRAKVLIAGAQDRKKTLNLEFLFKFHNKMDGQCTKDHCAEGSIIPPHD